MPTKCPNCGSTINYFLKGSSYHLRCKKSIKCWCMPCNKNTAIQYPEYIDPKEEDLAYRMREKILDDDCDYFHDC